jgi:G:T-mismatch repair DNA endonuclease (very short patch repair protein)
LARNRRRDRAINSNLKEKGWAVVRIWEHSLERPAWIQKKLTKTLAGASSNRA